MFTEECINTFLENQEQLFPQPVAESYEAAEAFLEDCMAQVVDSIEEVREYLEEAGVEFQFNTEVTNVLFEFEGNKKIAKSNRV